MGSTLRAGQVDIKHLTRPAHTIAPAHPAATALGATIAKTVGAVHGLVAGRLEWKLRNRSAAIRARLVDVVHLPNVIHHSDETKLNESTFFLAETGHGNLACHWPSLIPLWIKAGSYTHYELRNDYTIERQSCQIAESVRNVNPAWLPYHSITRSRDRVVR